MANPVMTGLTAYVEQNRLPLIKKAVLTAKSAALFNLQTDIKTSAAINLLNTDVKFGDGTTCGWDEAGTSTLTQRVIETGPIKVNMSFCDKEMLKYWTQYQVKVAAGQKTLPFEEDFVNAVIDGIKANVEKGIYQGDTSSMDVNLKRFNGLIKILTDDSNTIDVTIKGTSAFEDIKTVYNAMPQTVVDSGNAAILVGGDMFRKYIGELVDKNYFHYSGENVGEIMLPGSEVRVISVPGLNGTNKIIAGRLDHICYGCDMVNDEEKFELWYSQDNREFRLAVEFNAGVQVAYPDEVVLGATA